MNAYACMRVQYVINIMFLVRQPSIDAYRPLNHGVNQFSERQYE